MCRDLSNKEFLDMMRGYEVRKPKQYRDETYPGENRELRELAERDMPKREEFINHNKKRNTSGRMNSSASRNKEESVRDTDFEWYMANGDGTKVCEMDNNHLRNSIGFIQKKLAWFEKVAEILATENEYRKAHGIVIKVNVPNAIRKS